MTVREALAVVRRQAKEHGHGRLHLHRFGDNSTRLSCEDCTAACWLEHDVARGFCEVPDDHGLMGECGG